MLKTVRLRRINVWQAAKIAAIIYLLLFAVIFIPLGLFMTALPTPDTGVDSGVWQAFGTAFFFVAPLLYAFFGFIFTAIACAVYNLVAGWTGGIEIQTESVATDPDLYQ
ncbi:hypothetical protein GU926_14000 [Nibribacter ruber]|uniref:DUF3566 domain-containing protein n=1 Tax=Nibribacter ruber TaxID=2698458 RepID=A0A6P1P273_9BACT|nr:hypothetical protein [Nibribacter ruber]QHL88482.1 hypothetical protein GU926_14000 [Nibribacter ruber]